MKRFAIFDLNGGVAFFDVARNATDAIRQLAMDDESYATLHLDHVYELDDDEAALLQTWMDNGQASHLWPFDWGVAR